jgi:hypothetical protein
MKNGIKQIVGKTVSGIVVASKDGAPRQQLFLSFTDGTYFEIWGESFSCAGGVDTGSHATAVAYATGLGAKITAVYGDAAA